MPISSDEVIRAVKSHNLTVIRQFLAEVKDLNVKVEGVHLLAFLIADGTYEASQSLHESQMDDMESEDDDYVESDDSLDGFIDNDYDEDKDDKDYEGSSSASSSEEENDDSDTRESQLPQEQEKDANIEQSQSVLYSASEEDEPAPKRIRYTEKKTSIKDFLIFFINHGADKTILAQVILGLLLEKITFKAFIGLVDRLGCEPFTSNIPADLLIAKNKDEPSQSIALVTSKYLALYYKQLREDYKNEVLEKLICANQQNRDATETMYLSALTARNYPLINYLVFKLHVLPHLVGFRYEETTLLNIFIKKCRRPKILKQIMEWSVAEDKKALNPQSHFPKDSTEYIDAWGNSPLLAAVESKNASAMELLVKEVDSAEIQSAHILHVVARDGRDKVVCYLIENKHIPVDDENENHQSPLFLAVKSLCSEWAKVSDACECKDIQEFTPREQNLIFTILFLLKHDAKVTKNSDKGFSPLQKLTDFVKKKEIENLAGFKKSLVLQKLFKLFQELEQLEMTYTNIISSTEKLILQRYLINLAKLDELYSSARQNILLKPQFEGENDQVKLQILHNESEIKQVVSSLFIELEKEKYVAQEVLNIFQLINRISAGSAQDMQSNHEYFGIQGSPAFYTFIKDAGWFALPGQEGSKVSQAVLTILLYKARRYVWDSSTCQLGRKIYAKITGDEANLKLSDKVLYQALERMENTYGFAGENFSDDSDDEHVIEHGKKTRGERAAADVFARKIIIRSQVGCFFTKKKGNKEGHLHKLTPDLLAKDKLPAQDEESFNKNKKKVRKDCKTIMKEIKLEDRAAIVHDEGVPPTNVINDLNELNELYKNNKLTKETIKNIGTKFSVAAYRGIHYATDIWRKKEREDHRRFDESKIRPYSRAIYAKAELNECKDLVNLDNESVNKLENCAAIIADQLRTLRLMGPIICKTANYYFDSPLDALQDFYTKSYSNFHLRMKHVAQKKREGGLLTESLDIALSFISLNPKVPTLSTGDTPYHALRYAYGSKFYKDKTLNQEDSRLRPRWHSNGRAERPYSGKVYTYLLSPLDFIESQSNHLISMNREGRVFVDPRKISERETTFWGAMPAGKLIHQHIARYPSFHHSYSNLFLTKYGLDETQYKEYQEKLVESKPHSYTQQLAKLLLGEHLCAFYEATLIEDARLAAREEDSWLIYRDDRGGFSLVPPRLYPENCYKEDTPRGEAARRQQKEINKRREERQAKTMADGWLARLSQEYNFRVGSNLLHVLQQLLNKPKEELKEIIDNHFKVNNIVTTNEYIVVLKEQLKAIAKHFSIQFTLEFPSDGQEIISYTANSASDIQNKHQLAYLGGDNVCGLIRKTPQKITGYFQPQKSDERVAVDKTKSKKQSSSNAKDIIDLDESLSASSDEQNHLRATI